MLHDILHSCHAATNTTFLVPTQDEKIGEIEERVSIITGIPLVNGGEMQVLRYEHMQKYAAHNDYFPFEYLSEKDGRQRTATILFYLTDVEKGGETHFPVGRPLKDYVGRHNEELIHFSFCARRSASFGTYSPAAVRPKRGDALLFYSMDPSNQLVDPVSIDIHSNTFGFTRQQQNANLPTLQSYLVSFRTTKGAQ